MSFSTLLFCVAVYLSQPIIIDVYNVHFSVQLLWQHIPTAIPALFFFCCLSVFSDHFELKLGIVALSILSFFPPLIHDALLIEGQLLGLIMVTIPQGLEFILLALGFWVIASSWKNDLIEQRRLLRILVMGGIGALILLIIVAQQFSQVPDQYIDLVHYPLIAIYLFLFNFYILSLNKKAVLFQSSSPKHFRYTEEDSGSANTEQHQDHCTVKPSRLIQSSEPIQKNNKLDKPHASQTSRLKAGTKGTKGTKDTLNTLINQPEVFTEAALTITQLAYRLDIPEYKLRRLINEELGFRNFNDFLNHYRIKEACQRLLTSNESVTQIAGDVGYNSISAFNRAFKIAHQQTPSEFRKASSVL